MTVPPNEFSRPVRLDSLGAVARTFPLAADAAERGALAQRFGLAALDRLEASVSLRRADAIVHAEGTLLAEVTQSCVATGEPLPVTLEEPFTLRFAPEAAEIAGEEIELDAEACDTIPYSGGAIDLGEAVAETMALALDPFPRGPNAEAALRAAGVVAEGEEQAEPGPFARLAALRGKPPPQDGG